MKLREIADLLQCTYTGNGEVLITGVAPIESAAPGELTFLSNPRYRRRLKETRAAAVIVAPDAGEFPLPTLRAANPYLTFARAIELFHPAVPFPTGIHPTAVIHAGRR